MSIIDNKSRSLLESTLPTEALKIINMARQRGHNVEWLVGDATKNRRIQNAIVPNRDIPNDVIFTGQDGNSRLDHRVVQASNAISIEYIDPACSKRPGHDRGFVVSDEFSSSKHSLPNAFGFGIQDLKIATEQWLGYRELVAIPSKIADGPNGSAIDIVYIAPKKMAWAKLAWDIIHKAPSKKRLLEDFNPKAVFFAAPGLRPTLFDNTQCTVFDPNGKMTLVYTNTTYQGLGMSKKPIFVLLSRELVEQGKGFMAHATMAVLESHKTSGEKFKKGFIYYGASGHGKTEFRFRRTGKLVIGHSRSSDFSDVVISYPTEAAPKLIAGGDDGVIMRDFNEGQGFGVGENSEKGGAFDRPSSSFKEGDLPENDELLRLSEGNPFSHLTLNLKAKPNKRLKTYERVPEESGKPHSNPRQTYHWSALSKTSALKDANISLTTDPITFSESIFGMGVVKDLAVVSWANQLPLCCAYTMLLAGVCKSKSVSVTDGDGGVNYGGLKTDRFGTMESFSINENVTNANRMWEMVKAFHKVSHWIAPIGWVGPKFEVADNEAEILLRDFLFHLETGEATWKLVPGKAPFFGLIPQEASFFVSPIPDFYSDPFRQFSNADDFKAATKHILNVITNAVSPILHDDRLDLEAKKAILKALNVPVFEADPEKAWRIYKDLQSV